MKERLKISKKLEVLFIAPIQSQGSKIEKGNKEKCHKIVHKYKL